MFMLMIFLMIFLIHSILAVLMPIKLIHIEKIICRVLKRRTDDRPAQRAEICWSQRNVHSRSNLHGRLLNPANQRVFTATAAKTGKLTDHRDAISAIANKSTRSRRHIPQITMSREGIIIAFVFTSGKELVFVIGFGTRLKIGFSRRVAGTGSQWRGGIGATGIVNGGNNKFAGFTGNFNPGWTGDFIEFVEEKIW